MRACVSLDYSVGICKILLLHICHRLIMLFSVIFHMFILNETAASTAQMTNVSIKILLRPNVFSAYSPSLKVYCRKVQHRELYARRLITIYGKFILVVVLPVCIICYSLL